MVCRPKLVAGKAAPLRRLHAVLPSADEDGFAVDQGFGDPGAPTLEHPPDRLPRNAHGRGGLFVAETLEIDQADGFELVDGER